MEKWTKFETEPARLSIIRSGRGAEGAMLLEIEDGHLKAVLHVAVPLATFSEAISGLGAVRGEMVRFPTVEYKFELIRRLTLALEGCLEQAGKQDAFQDEELFTAWEELITQAKLELAVSNA